MATVGDYCSFYCSFMIELKFKKNIYLGTNCSWLRCRNCCNSIKLNLFNQCLRLPSFFLNFPCYITTGIINPIVCDDKLHDGHVEVFFPSTYLFDRISFRTVRSQYSPLTPLGVRYTLAQQHNNIHFTSSLKHLLRIATTLGLQLKSAHLHNISM